MPATVLEKPETTKASEQRHVYKPAVALYDSDESYVVLFELPGADEKALQVRIEKNILTIDAPLKLDLPTGARPRYSEMRLGDYRRSLDLGQDIDEDKIEATFKSGLLKLTMPKSKTARTRKIPIKTA